MRIRSWEITTATSPERCQTKSLTCSQAVLGNSNCAYGNDLAGKTHHLIKLMELRAHCTRRLASSIALFLLGTSFYAQRFWGSTLCAERRQGKLCTKQSNYTKPLGQTILYIRYCENKCPWILNTMLQGSEWFRFFPTAKQRRLGATQIRNRHKSHHCWKPTSVTQYFTDSSMYKYITEHTQVVIPSVYCDIHKNTLSRIGWVGRKNTRKQNAFDFPIFLLYAIARRPSLVHQSVLENAFVSDATANRSSICTRSILLIPFWQFTQRSPT
jgi:hypothetical protein